MRYLAEGAGPLKFAGHALLVVRPAGSLRLFRGCDVTLLGLPSASKSGEISRRKL